MIRHIVFFTATDENVDEVRAGLSLLTANPHASVLEIGTNVKTDQLGTDIDLVVYGEFENEAALAAYKAHPIYQQSIDAVRPIREVRIAADYDSDRAVKMPLR
ncbi:Stress responsive A/B Barrel Domain [Rhizobium sp. NFR07]|jgi:quinol monooxygenase YgiN|uniref:Dabb family protein n=1 Tax=Rhizobium sp. NFR07 TaxID=1566262 RepID=UPI0008F1ABBD|nr:Dabb family protein [Rhizobium sp. NFR07]SFB64456.1 Stress responsive A/B Barrel Domain [Rhizobium sp. NFR07]